MKSEPQVEFSLTLNLKITEIEARALDAMVGYGTDEFLKVFYANMGKSYMQPHEQGLRSLFAAVKREIPFQLGAVDKVKAAIEDLNVHITKDNL